jgi:hypothetical protein
MANDPGYSRSVGFRNFVANFVIHAVILVICFYLSDLLHSVKWVLGSFTSLEVTQMHSFL